MNYQQRSGHRDDYRTPSREPPELELDTLCLNEARRPVGSHRRARQVQRGRRGFENYIEAAATRLLAPLHVLSIHETVLGKRTHVGPGQAKGSRDPVDGSSLAVLGAM